MVIDVLMDELKYIVEKYGINSKEAYKKSMQIAFEVEKKYAKGTVESYYNESMYALIEYIRSNEKNPNEKTWNRIAVANRYLSSETIGYLYGKGFNKLCRTIRKNLKNII